MLRRVFGEDVELVTALDERLGHIKALPCMLEQVVLNLCVNARDAMPHGGRLSVETRDTDLDEFLARQLDLRPGPCVASGRRAASPFLSLNPFCLRAGNGINCPHNKIHSQHKGDEP